MEVEVINSECSEYLDTLDDNSIDACVTDPPYELGFMDKDWDRSGIAFDPAFWEKVKRVLKPGAHMAVFGGSRTYHRIAVGIEDAGFEIRDTIDWIYAEGFAKSHDVGKAIDEHLGKKDDRNRIGLKEKASRKDGSMVDRNSYGNQWTDNPSGWEERGRNPYKTAPASDEAKKWDGWDTQLKPAKEPIIIARKPLEGTVAENVLEHGTGALNIGDSRVGTKKNVPSSVSRSEDGNSLSGSVDGSLRNETGNESGHDPNTGRWPANVIFDSKMAEEIDEQSGRDLTAGGDVKEKQRDDTNVYGEYWGTAKHESYDDKGGASRYFKTIDYHVEDNLGFFYCPKAKRNERDLGVEGGNDHVTVKPIELMSYLVRLLAPKEGHILDPFAGSGTTGMSAALEGAGADLVEMDEDYCEIARQRVRYAKTNYQSLREDIYGDAANNITDEQTDVNDHNFW